MSEITAADKKKTYKRRSREIEHTPQKLAGIDEPFTVLVLLLLLIGLVCLYSASYVDGYYDSRMTATSLVVKQGVFAVVGIGAMLFVSRIDYHKLILLAVPLMVLSTLLLASIKIVPGIWVTANKATRWISLKVTTFQPSEITKFAFILFFSAWATIQGSKRMHKFRYGILPFFLLMGITTGLLYLQPHLSATVTIAGIGVIIIFLGGASFVWLIGIAGVGAAGIVGYLKLNPYAMTRIKVWFDPFSDFKNKGWQGAQSQLSIASGGIWGLGLGQGRQKHLYLPEPANDFIFSVICEELGFIGASIILLLFSALILRGYYIASKAPDKFGMLLAAGVTTQIAVQTIFNVGVVSGLLPVTGASLPFFSAGGTSLLMLMAEVGVVLSVSRRRVSDKDKSEG